MLYDGGGGGERGSQHKLQQKGRSWRRGCRLHPRRKSHEPNHRKLITADKMAAAAKSGESSARTGGSQQGAKGLSAHRLNKRRTKLTMLIIDRKYEHAYTHASILMSIVSGTLAAGMLLLYY